MRILILSLAACGSVTTYQSADTIGKGNWSGHAAIGVGAFKDNPQDTKTPTANVEVGARYGVADNTDVGLKLYTIGIEASIRQRLFDGGIGGSSWALVGAIGGVRLNENGAIAQMILAQARLGAVTTRRTSARWGWNIGVVTTGSLFVPTGGGHATGAMLGVLGGFDWRFGTKWHLLPELSIHRTIAGDVPVDGSVAQLGVAFTRDF